MQAKVYEAILRPGDALAIPAYWLHCVRTLEGPSFAYSLPVHYFHTRRDRVASLPPCRLYDAAMQRAPPLGPGRALTSPCRWDITGRASARRLAWDPD